MTVAIIKGQHKGQQALVKEIIKSSLTGKIEGFKLKSKIGETLYDGDYATFLPSFVIILGERKMWRVQKPSISENCGIELVEVRVKSETHLVDSSNMRAIHGQIFEYFENKEEAEKCLLESLKNRIIQAQNSIKRFEQKIQTYNEKIEELTTGVDA